MPIFKKIKIQNFNFEFNFAKFIEHIVYIVVLLSLIYTLEYFLKQPHITSINFLIAYISFLLIYYWSDINRIIIYSVLGNDIDYFYVYNDTKKKNLSSNDFIEYVKNKNMNNACYLNILDEHKKFDFINNYLPILLLKLEKNLSNKHNTNLFFVVSFFSINFVYSILILAIIYLIKALNIVYFIDDKVFIILIITSVFGFTIYIFLKSFSFFHNFITQLEDSKNIKILESIEIYPKSNNLKNIKQKINDIKNRVEEREASAFQLSIPVFYLAYVSLAISYF